MPGELGKLEFRFAEFCASFRAVDGAASSDEGEPETILHGESRL